MTLIFLFSVSVVIFTATVAALDGETLHYSVEVSHGEIVPVVAPAYGHFQVAA